MKKKVVFGLFLALLLVFVFGSAAFSGKKVTLNMIQVFTSP